MDISNLLKSLNAHKVAYVVIGATAFPVHGYSRATMDIDVFIKPTRQNAQATIEALKSFGYDTSDLSIKDILTKKVLIRQYLVQTDIHPFVKGITFKQAWANKVKSKIGRASAYFASLDDLIQMKKAAGRPQDKADLKVLNRLKKNAI
ncbi:MAG: nucleotidyltransferase [Planctomycetota bacterium]